MVEPFHDAGREAPSIGRAQSEITLCSGTEPLELSGSNKRIQLNPTRPECLRIRPGLETIANWIFDRDENVTIEFSHHEQSIGYCAAGGNRPDVTLAVRILHRSGRCEIHDLEL